MKNPDISCGASIDFTYTTSEVTIHNTSSILDPFDTTGSAEWYIPDTTTYKVTRVADLVCAVSCDKSDCQKLLTKSGMVALTGPIYIAEESEITQMLSGMTATLKNSCESSQ